MTDFENIEAELKFMADMSDSHDDDEGQAMFIRYLAHFRKMNSDYDALAQQLAASEARATVNAEDCNDAERKLAARDKQLDELKQAFSESQEEVVIRGKLLADAVGLLRKAWRHKCTDIEAAAIDALLASIEAKEMKEQLLPCPFCGKALEVSSRKFNPYARCVTDGCTGSRLPLLNLDIPADIEAWNTRAQAAASEPKPVEPRVSIEQCVALKEAAETLKGVSDSRIARGDRLGIEPKPAQWQYLSKGDFSRWINIDVTQVPQAIEDGFEVRSLFTHPAPAVVVLPHDWEEKLHAEMKRRFELSKRDDHWLCIDDTQIGVEFASDWVRACLDEVTRLNK